jgi:hypothetical protein
VTAILACVVYIILLAYYEIEFVPPSTTTTTFSAEGRLFYFRFICHADECSATTTYGASPGGLLCTNKFEASTQCFTWARDTIVTMPICHTEDPTDGIRVFMSGSNGDFRVETVTATPQTGGAAGPATPTLRQGGGGAGGTGTGGTGGTGGVPLPAAAPAAAALAALAAPAALAALAALAVQAAPGNLAAQDSRPQRPLAARRPRAARPPSARAWATASRSLASRSPDRRR